jgi:large subunit ribosomal protein L18
MPVKKLERRIRIRLGIRKKVAGSKQSPRLSVFRSNRGIYAQIIDDSSGHTLVAANSTEVGGKLKLNVATSKSVGQLIAKKAKESGIETVVFDRGGFLYHGNVKALAEGAREGGLKF